jgi:hypothetical protein
MSNVNRSKLDMNNVGSASDGVYKDNNNLSCQSTFTSMNDAKRIISNDSTISLKTTKTNSTSTGKVITNINNNKNVSEITTGTIPLSAFVLPNGQIMDAKNTLQSFDDKTILANVVATTIQANKLNDNKTIIEPICFTNDDNDNNNNTVYASPAATVPTVSSKVPSLRQRNNTIILDNQQPNDNGNSSSGNDCNIVSNSNNNNINNNRNNMNTGNDINIHAVAVHSFAVAEAETFDPLLLQPPQPPLPPTSTSTPSQNIFTRRYIIIAVLFVCIVVAAGIGGYCASGKCSNTKSIYRYPNTNSSSSEDASLTVACDFLNFNNLPSCTIATSFDQSIDSGQRIPSQIGLLTQLTLLDLNSNQMIDTIPSSLGNLIQLTKLDLGNNRLSGSIPSSFENLNKLMYLDLYNNTFTSTIPSLIFDQTHLTSLDISMNTFTGTIPSSIAQLVQLLFLDLSDNELFGTIPISIDSLIELTALGLSVNRLTGIIPTSLGSLTQLTALGLGYNNLTGVIPPSFGNLVQLTYLGLNDNNLTGTVPSSLESLSLLNKLDLSNNMQLYGAIPKTLCTLSNQTQRQIKIDCTSIIVCSCCITSDVTTCP